LSEHFIDADGDELDFVVDLDDEYSILPTAVEINEGILEMNAVNVVNDKTYIIKVIATDNTPSAMTPSLFTRLGL